MAEDIENKLQNLYNEIMEKPNTIKEIFEDFFGEDKIDIQGFPSYEKFKEFLDTSNLNTYFSLNKDILYNLDSTSRDLITYLWNHEDAGNYTLLSDNALFLTFFPIIKSFIANYLFEKIFILVHFPNVRVTNEYNKYIDITHLYAKIYFNWEGKGKGYFGLNRAEYDYVQFTSNYLHSHVSGIPKDNFSYFKTPCTGSGPINGTLSTLAIDFDESIWQLFCLELDKYVKTESIDGVPYYKLEQVGTSTSSSSINTFPNRYLFSRVNTNVSFLRDSRFIEYLLKSKILVFNYINNQYGIGMSWIDYIVTLSNVFIEWYNKEYVEGNESFNYTELIENGHMNEVIIKDNRIYYFDSMSRGIANIKHYQGAFICTFKGKEIRLNIKNIEVKEGLNKIAILKIEYAEVILKNILRVLNYRYGRNEIESTSEENSSTGKKKYYF